MTRRIGRALAVVLLVTSVATTVGPGRPAAAGDASVEPMLRACAAGRPTGWWLEGGHPNPQGCLKCESAGRFWESTGNYRAWCSKEANGAILWLFCKVCRPGEPAIAWAKLDADPPA